MIARVRKQPVAFRVGDVHEVLIIPVIRMMCSMGSRGGLLIFNVFHIVRQLCCLRTDAIVGGWRQGELKIVWYRNCPSRSPSLVHHHHWAGALWKVITTDYFKVITLGHLGDGFFPWRGIIEGKLGEGSGESGVNGSRRCCFDRGVGPKVLLVGVRRSVTLWELWLETIILPATEVNEMLLHSLAVPNEDPTVAKLDNM
ncbi:predicted protein [Histoplasma capsulatum H143]|uniref:Uncharacterized protein n=1 Tax=Ajellomyces capsulatus (strain H143) TaxID=544712 RepID=C6HSI4_AJECH|nr:predicted protein [Histoplasma capsulatum H143]